MKQPLADRVLSPKPSFIREILKVTQKPDIISFAGGLPNPNLFPVEPLKKAILEVLTGAGPDTLQYTITAGYLPLRQWIVDRYYHHIQGITADNIVITTGSQQAIDLLGKMLLNSTDKVIVEDPSYLGALQALSVYQPELIPVKLTPSGLDLEELEQKLSNHQPKVLYLVPTFQNPTGITYTLNVRQQLAQLITRYDVLVIEDDPYQEIRFLGQPEPSIKSFAPELTFHLGSFSKTVAPGLRLGWVCLPSQFQAPFTTLKEAADLHSNHLSQRLIHHFLTHNDFDIHLDTIKAVYHEHRQLMLEEIKNGFPPHTEVTKPEGGMFIWVTLPEGKSSSALFDAAIQQHVAFVPGKYFFPNQDNDRCLRLNFSNANGEDIAKGIKILGSLL